METAQDTPTTAPPYFAFRTLLNTLDQMKERGVPRRIDRSYLTAMSGAGQTQFITGLKSLGLIDSEGTVTERLTALAQANPAERKRLLAEVLRERYPEAVELGTTNATTGQLVEVFNNVYGAKGDTARKAIAFYLQAARYAEDIPLSPLFETPRITTGAGSRRRRQTQSGTDEPTAETGDTTAPTSYSDLHPALAGVLSELPKRGQSWTRERRDAFMNTLGAVINFTIPVREAESELFADEGDEE